MCFLCAASLVPQTSSMMTQPGKPHNVPIAPEKTINTHPNIIQTVNHGIHPALQPMPLPPPGHWLPRPPHPVYLLTSGMPHGLHHHGGRQFNNLQLSSHVRQRNGINSSQRPTAAVQEPKTDGVNTEAPRVVGIRKPLPESPLNIHHIMTFPGKFTDLLRHTDPALLFKPFNLLDNLCYNSHDRYKNPYLCFYVKSHCVSMPKR